MMNKALGLVLLLVAVATTPAVARAAWYDGFYFGSGVGLGRIEAELVPLGLLPEMDDGMGGTVNEPIESTDFKKSSVGAKFFAGYRFARYLAIEGGYTKIYDVDEQFCFLDDTGGCTEDRGGAISSSAWSVEMPTDGWTGYVVGLLPFGNDDAFDVFVKVGVIAWETDVTAREEVVGNFVPVKDPLIPARNPPVTRQLDGTDLATGIGVNFNHPNGVTIRSEFEYFDISEFEQSFLLSFSAVYNF
jgi:opacity protein-like surface antigen